MATISPEQIEAVSALESVLDDVIDRSKSFASDLVNKGQKYSLSEKQMYWVKRITAEATPSSTPPATPVSGGAPVSTPPATENLSELCDKLDEVRPYLSHRSQTFAQSLIRQGRNKGYLSAKQLPYVHKMIDEGTDAQAKGIADKASRDAARAARAAAREAHRIATTPVSDSDAMDGFEAVLELFDAAGATLTRTKIHLITDDGREVVVRSNRRHKETNEVLYVHNHGADYNDRDAQYGHINKATAGWNFTPATNAEVHRVMTLLRDDPLGTVMDMGRKSGRCCFCSLPLTDYRSTAHGYGPICAKHYRLPYSKATAMVIEGEIESKVLEVIIMRDDEGNFAVKDHKTGETICTFTSRQAANEYADQFSIVEKV